MNVAKAFCKGSKHLTCSLRMTDIRNFLLSCLLNDIVNKSWDVILPKLEEGVVKELLLVYLLIWIKCFMFIAINCSPIVSHPYIVAFIGKLVGYRVVSVKYKAFRV